MARRGRRGNGHARHAQPVVAAVSEEPEDDIVVLDESGNEVADDGDGLAPRYEEPEQHEAVVVDPRADDEFVVLQRQFDELKAAKEADATRLREYEQKNAAQAQDVQASHEALIDHALRTAQSELTSAKTAFKTAMTAGDYEAAAEAQGAIAEAQLDARQYELARDDFTRQSEAAKNQPKRQRFANREEMIAAQMATFNPKTREWATKHKSSLWKSDTSLNQAMALHEAAVNGGFVPETTEYFEYIERGMGIKSEPVDQQRRTQRSQQERRPPMASAPVSRGGNAPNGRIEVQLTQAQRDIARRMGMTSQKYAKYLDTIQKNQDNPDWRGPRLSTANGQLKA